MGIDVQIETENGEMETVWADPRGLTKAMLLTVSEAHSCCLRFVDLYGDTVFNQIQIPILITEIRRQLEGIKDPEARDHVGEILRLVESAEGRVHTYVRFVGD